MVLTEAQESVLRCLRKLAMRQRPASFVIVAEAMALSEVCVRNAIRALEQGGYLRREDRDGRYRFVIGEHRTRWVAKYARRGQTRQTRRIPCLCCGRTFPSEGAHNRMCDACRKTADDVPSFSLTLKGVELE